MEPVRPKAKLPSRLPLSAGPETGAIVAGVSVGMSDLDAALKLLAAAPGGGGIAFAVFDRHDDVRDIADLLAGKVAMPVVRIEDGTALRADHIYVSPPNALIGVQHGLFRISSHSAHPEPGSRFGYFLTSLAKECGERSVAISLGEMGEGANSGLRALHDEGGLVVVRDPFAGDDNEPPRRAYAVCVPNLVLPVERIPSLLLWLSAAERRHDLDAVGPSMRVLAQIIHQLSATSAGRNVASYKEATLLRRVLRRMTALGIKDLAGYLGALQGASDEPNLLAKDMLIHVTSFFRDPRSYDFLAKTIIPKLVRQHPRTDPIRVWIAGCSTGEEAYSIAILFFEEITRSKRDLTLQIFASDVSATAIAHGRTGLYSESIRHQVSGPRLRRFFMKEAGGYRVTQRLRESVLFAVHDLLSDAPFSRLDMIVCRNVLIYMRRQAQKKILSLFHFALRERGVLFFGVADTIGAYSSDFKPISYADRTFERVGGQQKRPLSLPIRRSRGDQYMTHPKPEHEIAATAVREAIDGKQLLILQHGDQQEDRRGELQSGAQQEALRSARLEEELAATRKRLERTIQDLERVNEELIAANQEAMSVNEELQSINEELEASKEEMQSLNEELMILNQQLQDSAEQQRSSAIDLRNILNSADVATLFLDSEFNIRFFTPPAKALFGLIASDVGRPLVDLARRFTDDRLLDDARSVLANLMPSKREIFTKEDSWYLRKIAPYRTEEGRAKGVVITFSDITEMKLVERDIRAAHAFAESVVETVREPLLVLDKTLRVSVVNKALRDLFCADSQQFIGLALDSTPARRLAPLMQNVLDAARDGHGHVENYRIEINVPPRGRLALMMTTREIGGNTSAAGMILLVLEDITEKERIEQGLMTAKQGLEHANLTKSQFLAAASHDLRQPLQTLRLLCAILQRKLTDEEALKLNAKCGETIDAMTSVVNAILDINQLEAGAIRPAVHSFPANMLLNKLHSEFNFLVQAKGLTWRVASCSSTLRSDPRLLTQILRNLVSNAIKFTSSGKLLVGCRRRGGNIAIEVWDSGPGIPEADIVKIFEFFQKGQANSSGVDDGLGLGLAIVKRLAEILDHEIGVVSRLGRGCCFSVLVPIGEQTGRQLVAMSEARGPVAKERGIRMLIVEDEPSVRETLEMLLANEGQIIVSARSGREALELIRSNAFCPEMIIVDYSIPGGMNGLDVIDEVRALFGQQIPAAVLTGDISSAAFAKIATKANVHLTKPVQAEELLEAIQRLRETAPRVQLLAPSVMFTPTIADSPADKAVFVVDDDVAVRDSIQQLLESCGHRVAAYASGREFIEAESANHGGCLILDARMPGMDGFEVLTHIAARSSNLPTIMVTGHGDVQTAVRAMKAGAFDFIEKPVDPDQLCMSVDRAVRTATNSEEDVTRRAAAARSVARLTKRQRAVLDLIVAGHANKVIAIRLGIGQRTVESHRATVMKKLGARTFADLIRLALAAP